jgi:hypothetical protein
MQQMNILCKYFASHANCATVSPVIETSDLKTAFLEMHVRTQPATAATIRANDRLMAGLRFVASSPTLVPTSDALCLCACVPSIKSADAIALSTERHSFGDERADSRGDRPEQFEQHKWYRSTGSTGFIRGRIAAQVVAGKQA